MKRIVVFNIVLITTGVMNASASVTPVSLFKKLVSYIGIDANSW